MKKTIVVVAVLGLSVVALCGCLFVAVVVSDFWRYGVPAMAQQRREQGPGRQDDANPSETSGMPSGSASKGSDALVQQHNCHACHGQELQGKQLGLQHAPDITSSGAAGRWSEAEFIAAMRTGERPDNGQLSDTMPWRAIGRASDDELKKLFAYLKSLP